MPQINTTPALIAPKLYAYLHTETKKRVRIRHSTHQRNRPNCRLKMQHLRAGVFPLLWSGVNVTQPPNTIKDAHVPLGGVTFHSTVKTEDPDFPNLPTGKRA